VLTCGATLTTPRPPPPQINKKYILFKQLPGFRVLYCPITHLLLALHDSHNYQCCVHSNSRLPKSRKMPLSRSPLCSPGLQVPYMRNPKTRVDVCVGCNKSRDISEPQASQQLAAQDLATGRPAPSTAAANTSAACKQEAQTQMVQQHNQEEQPAASTNGVLTISSGHRVSPASPLPPGPPGCGAMSGLRPSAAPGGVDAAQLLADMMVKGWALLDTTCPVYVGTG
jgi:hypothetical protein